MLQQIKNFSKRFYYSVTAITLLSLLVLAIIYSWNKGMFQPKVLVKKIYYADNISPTHLYLINKFNKLNEGKIEVIPIDLPFEKFSTNERKELLIRYLRNKSDRIDVFSVDQIWVPRFAKWTEPLNKYFLDSEKKLLIEEATKTCYYKNNLVAVPLYYDIGILYYNVDVLSKLPDYESIKKKIENNITWEEFINISVRLKKLGKPVYLYPADDFEGLMCSFVELLESQNSQLFIGDSVNLTNPETERALQLLVDVVNKYEITPPEVTSYRESECYTRFAQNDGLFLRGWTGYHVWYKNNIKDEDVSGKYFTAPIPHLSNGKPASIIGGWNLMLSKYSTKKSEAIEFIKFMISEESQKIMFERGGYLPINTKVYSNESFLNKHPEMKFYERLMTTGANRPFHDKYTKCSDIIAHYLNMAIQKRISVKEALSSAERVINGDEFFIK